VLLLLNDGALVFRKHGVHLRHAQIVVAPDAEGSGAGELLFMYEIKMKGGAHMKALLVYPNYPDTFWSFKHALKFISKKAAL